MTGRGPGPGLHATLNREQTNGRQGGSKGPWPVKTGAWLGGPQKGNWISAYPVPSPKHHERRAATWARRATAAWTSDGDGDGVTGTVDGLDGRRISRSARARTALPALDLAGPAGGLEATLRSSGGGRVRSQVVAGDKGSGRARDEAHANKPQEVVDVPAVTSAGVEASRG